MTTLTPARKGTAKEVRQSQPGWGFTLDQLDDDSLIHLARQYERTIEDDGADVDQARRHLARVRDIQEARHALSVIYGARCRRAKDGPKGSDIYDHVVRLGEPPSYNLAANVDLHRAAYGWGAILDWPQHLLDRANAWKAPTPLAVHEDGGTDSPSPDVGPVQQVLL